MDGKWSVEAGRAVVVVLIVASLLVVLGGAGIASVCKLTDLNCHLRSSPTVLSKTSGNMSLPAHFSSEVVASGLDVPTAFDFLPDGRILVAEKGGLVRIVDDGIVDSKPVLKLTNKINVADFRGLIAVAVDPNFDANHHFYVVYTPRSDSTAGDSKDPTHEVVSRFTLLGERAVDEQIVLGSAGDKAGTCSAPTTADCVPATLDHNGSDITFAPDGTLFVSTGDGGGLGVVEQDAFNAQDVDSLAGKILHITPDGKGLSSNPFFDGDPDSNRSKVWAIGFRNPFRITRSPSSNILLVGDVGWKTADEIDTVRPGANFGWPCFEGRARTSGYKRTAPCLATYRRGTRVAPPTIELHNPGSSSVTGGVFVSAPSYPKAYRMYYYADWVSSSVRRAPIAPDTGELLGAPTVFAEQAGGPVALRVGPDRDLYVLSLNYGQLQKITYKH